MGTPSGGGAWTPSQDQSVTGSWTFTQALNATGGIANTGQTTTSGATFITSADYEQTLTGSAYGASAHQDQVYSKLTLTPATAVTAANGLNAIRGEVNLTTGKTLGTTASFLTGVYGRGNIFGTVDIGSGDLAAVYGKFDLNGSTLTSGHIAPVQANIVNPPASAATAGVSLFYGESASGTPIGNGIELFMAAAYLMKLTQVSGGTFFSAVAPSSLAASLKVNVGGTDYYIGLYSAAS